jgi:hypothetical protein
LIANKLSFFSNNACVECRIKELEERIAEARKHGQELSEDGKKYYEQLKKLVGEDNPEREKETKTQSPILLSLTPLNNTFKKIMLNH